MKKIMGGLMAVSLVGCLLGIKAEAQSISDLIVQTNSNDAIIFINGYWVKPVYTEKTLSGFAFILHAVAVQDGMEDILRLSDSIKGLDDIAGQLSKDLLVAHASRLIDPLLIVGVNSKLDNWWEESIDEPVYSDDDYDTSIGNDGLPDGNWWDEIGDGIVFGDDPLNTNVNVGDDGFNFGDDDIVFGDDPMDTNINGGDTGDDNWADDEEDVRFGDDPIETNTGLGNDDDSPEWSDEDLGDDNDDSNWAREDEDEEEEGDDEAEDKSIIHCPPPGLCFQTDAMDAMGIAPDLIWRSVNIILNSVMSGEAGDLRSYVALEKGVTDVSVVNVDGFQ